MRFKIQTLVDVTQTHARKGEDPFLVKQQANFMSLYNVIGLRTNPIDFTVSFENTDLTGLGFGSAFKGKKTVWTVQFTVEQEDSLDVSMMHDDFDLVPFISGLTEDTKFKNNVFRTKDSKDCNIIFSQV